MTQITSITISDDEVFERLKNIQNKSALITELLRNYFLSLDNKRPLTLDDIKQQILDCPFGNKQELERLTKLKEQMESEAQASQVKQKEKEVNRKQYITETLKDYFEVSEAEAQQLAEAYLAGNYSQGIVEFGINRKLKERPLTFEDA